jgi:Uma2 family endonuclease
MATTKVYTIEDLEALPDDGHVWELIDGELVRREPVGGRHGALQARVARRIGTFVEADRLGEVFGSDTIYVFPGAPERGLRPDASFVRADRLPQGAEFDKPLTVTPDLVVEVVSPNDRPGTIDEKLETYQRAGVPLIWVFWPRRRTISVYAAGQPVRELTEGDELDGGEVLPGFRVAVADLFDVGR